MKGIAVPNAAIEVFSGDDDEGRWYHGTTTADAGGYFTFTNPAPFTGTNVTATATDGEGNTSEFSSPYKPSCDVVAAAVYVPQSHQQTGEIFTPTVRVGNGGTAPETFTVTAVITHAGARVYEARQIVTNLGGLSYRTLTFMQWSTTTLGSYSFAVGVETDAPDDDPGNDHLTRTFAIVEGRVDLWSRDNPTDDGREPSVGPIWASPDLWVRNAADGLTEPQNPINLVANTVYLRVRNRGTISGTDATVTVYWHPPSLVIGQSWWQPIGTVAVPPVEPGDIYTTSLEWQPQIGEVLTQPYHTCLLNVISSTQEPSPEMWDVRSSNNIQQRNVNIISQEDAQALLRAAANGTAHSTFSVGNPYPGEQLVDVILDATGVPTDTEVRIDLGGLFVRWQSMGQGSLTGGTAVSGTTQISMTGGGQAEIAGIPMAGEELFEIAVDFVGLDGEAQLDVSERVGGEVMGGVTLQVLRKQHRVYLPLVLRSH